MEWSLFAFPVGLFRLLLVSKNLYTMGFRVEGCALEVRDMDISCG